MTDKLSDKNLRRLRQYIAREARRLEEGGGRVHRIDLDMLEDEEACAIPVAPSDPLERDLDVLFGREARKRNPGL